MSLKLLISLLILGAIVLPLGFGLFLMFKDEIENSQRVTGGYGLPVLIGAMLVFVILPVVMFISSLSH